MEGQTQVIGITLESAPGASVTLTVTSSNPETVTISPSIVTFAAHEWNQTKNFSVIVPHNGFYGDTRNVIIMARASSAASAYNGIAGSASVHLTDMTPPPGYNDPQNPQNSEDDEDTDTSETINETPNIQTDDLINSNSTNEATLERASPEDWQSANLGVADRMGRNLQLFTDGLVPGRTSARQTFVSYFLLSSLALSAAALYILVRRRLWWQRQQARDERWHYRHQQKPATKTPAKKKRAKPKTKKRKV